MRSVFIKNNRYLQISLLFLIFFVVTAYLYIKRVAGHDRTHFQNQATIIADDIWALNQSGAQAYLQLAVKANHYKSLSVSIPGNDSYLRVTSPPLTGLDALFHRVNLIGMRKMAQEIRYQDLSIGTLLGEQYIRVIFPLLNILIFFLFLLLASTFIIHLFINRKFLEQQVKERTRNLQESERRFHDLVALLPEMILETDLEGTIVYANKAAINRLDLLFEKNISTNFFDFILKDERDEARHNFLKSLQGAPSGLSQFTICSKINKPYPALIRSAPIIDDHQISGARMIVIDITERRRLEEQLHRDQKMKAIGLMAGGVAHDLNNILSGIISYPELMLLDMEHDSLLRRPLEAIRKSGLDASEVVSDLLTVARGVAADKEIVSPNELILDYLDSADFKQLLTRYLLVSFNTSLIPELRNISCSPIHVRKCLMNLMTNGMEAIQGTGVLSISTENYEQTLSPQRNTFNLAKGNFAKIIIHDSGSGITADDLDHIFEPFYTKKNLGRSGTGLGLTVVWNTMRDHGGTVNVISDTLGTTFELYFPSLEKSILPPPEEKNWKTYKGRGESILVVDDEKRQREIVRQLLTSLDYSVQTVASGEEAIEYLRHQSVDLLVLDMLMSPGHNGRITYEQILKIHPLQKAVIASGFAENEDVRATLAMGAGAFISKPYTLEQIGSIIYKILHQ